MPARAAGLDPIAAEIIEEPALPVVNVNHVSRTRLDASALAFARRVIRRPPAAGEDHEPVSDAQFQMRLADGAFALHWQAHGFSYGISVIVDHWLADGKVVVANVSRAVVTTARRLYQNLLVIAVTAPAKLLAKRLSLRGRETETEIQQRLVRDQSDPITGCDVLLIENVGRPRVAGEQFAKILFDRL